METTLEEMTHEEIKNVLIEHLHLCRERCKNNQEALMCDSRSMALKNRGREYGAALREVEDILEDFNIDADEID